MGLEEHEVLVQKRHGIVALVGSHPVIPEERLANDLLSQLGDVHVGWVLERRNGKSPSLLHGNIDAYLVDEF